MYIYKSRNKANNQIGPEWDIMQASKELNISTYLKNFTYNTNLDFFSENAANRTTIEMVIINDQPVPRYINEFWTSRQRQASSIHEVSYRACFKPQLPRFFIRLLTKEGDVIYDPFSGRGTTPIEAALMNRRTISNDINPLSKIFTKGRMSVPSIKNIEGRLNEIPFHKGMKADVDISMFYHKDTESEIMSLREYLFERHSTGKEDETDRWIRMISTNRLTGHSKGFFSVYTLPPNQAVSQESQKKINIKRNQIPEYRNIREIIKKKSINLQQDLTEGQKQNLRQNIHSAIFLEKDARHTPEIKKESVNLTVTSPPFLDIVQYSHDNWLRCWFNHIDDKKISKKITMSRTLEAWSAVMGDVFKELFRITVENGWVAFEVGEVRKGTIKLDEYVVPLGIAAGFQCEGILINKQDFTKTANIWGINNNESGTNTNRIVLFKKG